LTKIDEKLLYDELVRLRLNTKRLRLEYVARQGRSLTDSEKEILQVEQERYQKKVELDRKAYLEKVRQAAADAGNGSKKVIPELVDRMSSAGLPEEDVKQFIEAIVTDESGVDRARVLALIEKLSLRAVQIEETRPGRRILDQSRFKDLDLSGWKKTEEGGIDLNLLDKDEETSTFDFDEYTEKLIPSEDTSENDA
jgi:hypothetical protein